MPIRSSKEQHRNQWWVVAFFVLATLGKPVIANEPPLRLISLAPHLTELAYGAGAGDRLVGVVSYSDFPEQASRLPVIGDAFRFDLETILSIEPTVALAWSGGTPVRVAEQLESLGIEVVWIETRTLEDIRQALLSIGDLLDDSTIAHQAADAFEKNLDQTRKRHAKDERQEVRVFYQIAARPLYTFGANHVINEVFEVCGAMNVFGDMATEALSIDRETVIERAPDYIVAGVGEETADQDAWAHWEPHFNGALQHTKVVVVDPNTLVRPTPRIVEGIEEFCAIVAAPTP